MAIRRLARQPELRQSLSSAGYATAQEHRLEPERQLAQQIMRDPLGNYDDAVVTGESSTKGTP